MRIRGAVLVTLVLAVPLQSQTFTFTHFVGTTGGPGSIDSSGAGSRFWNPEAVATDAAGNVYIAEGGNHTIRVVTPGGAASTVAGMAGEKGSATGLRHLARFDRPAGITVDPSGNIFVADSNNAVVRKITPAGVVTTFAGMPGISGDANGTGSAARFFLIFGMASDSVGNIYVAQYGSHTIRKITPAAVVTTLAGSPGLTGTTDGTGSAARFNRPLGMALDGDDNLYVADWVNNTIRKITPTGVVTTFAGAAGVCSYVDGTLASARFCAPRGMAFDPAGNMYVADGGNQRIRKIEAGTGTVSTFAGNGFQGPLDGVGTAASLSVQGIASDSSGNLYVPDIFAQTIRKITPAGVVSTLAGSAALPGFAAAAGGSARFNYPNEATVDSGGNLYIADTYNNMIRRVLFNSSFVTVFAGSTNSGSVNANGADARFSQPSGVATDGAGNVYVADTNNQTIRKITPAADVTTLAGEPLMTGSVDGTGSAARFSSPADVATDAAGNVYVADTNNHTIRKITPAGVVTTLAGMAGLTGDDDGTGTAARFNFPNALIVGSDGNLYVVDLVNQTIRKVTMGGVVTTLAGSPGEVGGADGTGSAARFHYPASITADPSGVLYVADGQQTIRRVTLGGVVTTVGGRYMTRGSEPGTGGVARFSTLSGIASANANLLYIVDEHTIRRGATALTDQATIDVGEGSLGAVRQLSTSPNTATTWSWVVTRWPVGSSANLSSSTTRTPTFAPDVPDLFKFRLIASNGTSSSITEVSLRGLSETLTVGPSTLPNAVRSLNYSATISASGGTAPYTFAILSGTLPGGLSLNPSGLLSGVPAAAGTFNFEVRATDSVGSIGDREYALTVVAGPGAVEAHATAATTVALDWAGLTQATAYRVYRSSSGTAFAFLAQSATDSFSDTTAIANTAYLYRVTAIDASAHESSPGAYDLATTVIFTDAPLVANTTPIRAVHGTQLRTAVNAVRVLAGIGTVSFTDPSLAGALIAAVHVGELRSFLAPARSALSLPALTLTDPTLTPEVTVVKAAHVEQLRSGVR